MITHILYQNIPSQPFQEIHGTFRIKVQPALTGTSRLMMPSSSTKVITNTGVFAIRNPLEFQPGFEQAPLITMVPIVPQNSDTYSSLLNQDWIEGPVIAPGSYIEPEGSLTEEQWGTTSIAIETKQPITGVSSIHAVEMLRRELPYGLKTIL